MYTDPNYTGKGIAKFIASALINEVSALNLMASTEITENPAMVSILNHLGFERYGKSWSSAIHGNELGLYLKYAS